MQIHIVCSIQSLFRRVMNIATLRFNFRERLDRANERLHNFSFALLSDTSRSCAFSSPAALDPECILKLLLKNISAAPDRLD